MGQALFCERMQYFSTPLSAEKEGSKVMVSLTELSPRLPLLSIHRMFGGGGGGAMDIIQYVNGVLSLGYSGICALGDYVQHLSGKLQ